MCTEPFTVVASETLEPAATSTEPFTPLTQAASISGKAKKAKA
jgi:hypothetical protein